MKLQKHNKRAFMLTITLYIYITLFLILFALVASTAMGGNGLSLLEAVSHPAIYI